MINYLQLLMKRLNKKRKHNNVSPQLRRIRLRPNPLGIAHLCA
jgi:hypothetical protein